MGNRNRKVTFRLNDDELSHFKRLVGKSGFSQEAYLRSLVQGIVPAERPPPDYLSMMRELHAIGNSLNQIAHKAHALNVIDASRYDEESRKLSSAVSEIVKTVKMPRRL